MTITEFYGFAFGEYENTTYLDTGSDFVFTLCLN